MQLANMCLLIAAFSHFTFKVNIDMCGFDPVIVLLAGYYVDLFASFFYSVNDLCTFVFVVCTSVCFCSGQ